MVGWLDVVLVVILLVAAVVGVVKGFVREAVGIAATIGGFILAAAYYRVGAGLLDGFIRSPVAARFVSFIAILILTVAAGWLLSKLLSLVIKGPLKLVDRLAGLFFGAVQGVLLCGVLVFAQIVFPVDRAALENSRLAPSCYGLAKTLIYLIPQELKDQFRSACRDILSRSEKSHG
jgi:membrane protein required for colicin V production